MRLRTLARAALVFVPLLLVCAGKLNAQRSASPDRMTQEVNRCLTLMRVAASRRRSGTEKRGPSAIGVRTDSAAVWAHEPERGAKSA